ncbi:hypothetical protein BCD67_22085 [Oscillatoriales cyanobacterium USR001]|nr:hypothetical protein BCD67_22085 [Oscillatoriales cyanobacterium USR001]
MAERLKSWESPRNEGRNSKGKGGSARARQLKKQQQTLRKQLKAQSNQQNNQGKGTNVLFLDFYLGKCQKIINQG